MSHVLVFKWIFLDKLSFLLIVLGSILVCFLLHYFFKKLQYELDVSPLSRQEYIVIYSCVFWLSCYFGIVLSYSKMIWIWMFYIWLVLLLSFIDMFYLLLPKKLIWLLACLGCVYQFYYANQSVGWILFSGLCGYGAMAFFYYGHLFLLNKPGIGYGDVRLSCALSIWLGAEYISWLLLLAAVFSISYIGIYYMFTRRLLRFCAFGPFLCLAATVVLIWCGNALAVSYFS